MCGILSYAGTRLREVCHVGITQQDPYQPVLSVWGGDFPDTYDFAIGDPDPLHVVRSVAQALTGLGPDLGLAGTSETLLR